MATRQYVRDAEGQFAEVPGGELNKIEARKAAKRARAKARREKAKAPVEKPAERPAPDTTDFDNFGPKQRRTSQLYKQLSSEGKGIPRTVAEWTEIDGSKPRERGPKFKAWGAYVGDTISCGSIQALLRGDESFNSLPEWARQRELDRLDHWKTTTQNFLDMLHDERLQTEAPEDMYFLRGVRANSRFDPRKSYIEGEEIMEEGAFSMAAKPGAAIRFRGYGSPDGWTMKIKLPKGKKYVEGHGHEGLAEAILGPGSTYRVVKRDDDRQEIMLEVLDDGLSI